MQKLLIAGLMLAAATPVFADEPDGLKLPKGFHATVVAEGLGPIRHMALRGNDIYISTRHGRDAPSVGVIALRLGADHKPMQTEHFGVGKIDQGTGIAIQGGKLYAATGTGVARFALDDALVPKADPEMIVDGLPSSNHPIAFDGKGGLYVGIDGGGGAANCPDPATPKDAKPKGLMPCPLLETKGGVWKFDDAKTGQKQADGEKFATGYRNMSAMTYRPGDAVYGIWHGRDATSKTWPDLLTQADDDAIADEMFRITKGTDMGWPYTYWDGVKHKRLVAPDYGGDGKTEAETGKYATPVAAFAPKREAPLDMAFYDGREFPAHYRGGAFLAMHGTGGEGIVLPPGHGGYDVAFVPFVGGKAGKPEIFADGFAGADNAARSTKTAAYRPTGVAVGPDGALYVADSVKGKIWRISYGQ